MAMADAGVLSRLFMLFVRIPARLPETQIVQPPQPRFIVAVEQAIGSALKPEVTGVVQYPLGFGLAPFDLELPHPHPSGLRLVEMTLADLPQGRKPRPRVPTKGWIGIRV